MITRILLSALAFAYVLPLIHGIHFHGGMLAAVGMALFFGLMLWVVDVLAIALSAILAVSTLGTALIWLIPVWIVGFWILPAVALRLVSDFMPGYLQVSGWIPAILGSLVLMLIGMVTSGSVKKFRRA